MIVIVDSGGANIASILFAFERVGCKAILSAEASVIRNASHVILPGVGAAAAAMRQLQQLNLIQLIKELTQPVLGICLGMQLLYEYSEEGNAACLGIIPGDIRKISAEVTVPHMGWNQLKATRASSLLQNIGEPAYVYFVHSYVAPASDFTLAVTEHGQFFSAVVQKNNFYGTQFHPERSGSVGERILRNFLEIKA